MDSNRNLVRKKPSSPEDQMESSATTLISNTNCDLEYCYDDLNIKYDLVCNNSSSIYNLNHELSWKLTDDLELPEFCIDDISDSDDTEQNSNNTNRNKSLKVDFCFYYFLYFLLFVPSKP